MVWHFDIDHNNDWQFVLNHMYSCACRCGCGSVFKRNKMAVSVSSVLSLQGGSGASKEDPVCNFTLSYKAGPASKCNLTLSYKVGPASKCNLTLSYKAGPASKPPLQLYSTDTFWYWQLLELYTKPNI